MSNKEIRTCCVCKKSIHEYDKHIAIPIVEFPVTGVAFMSRYDDSYCCSYECAVKSFKKAMRKIYLKEFTAAML